MEALQTYWWLINAVLGAALVFLLFVQGGQSMLLCNYTDAQRSKIVEVLGHKWELTFTTLVVFGGAMFASFPLFYSTSFGGAYWLWMLILFSFVLQAVSYEFRTRKGNVFGTRTYDVFLFINGCVGCVLLGVAVAMFFFGGAFTVEKSNLLDASAPVISTWAPTRGLEAIASWRCLLLGVAVFFLARTQAALYFINQLGNEEGLMERHRRAVMINGVIFVVLFVTFLGVLLASPGVTYSPDGGTMEWTPFKYFDNLLVMWPLTIVFVLGVVLVLVAVLGTMLSASWRGAIWYSGLGTVLVVVTLLCFAAFNFTAYLPSTLDVQSSLTIANSSSSEFTLTTMAWVSVITPFVIAYIAYVWRKMSH